jgi:hypothetical protein
MVFFLVSEPQRLPFLLTLALYFAAPKYPPALSIRLTGQAVMTKDQ